MVILRSKILQKTEEFFFFVKKRGEIKLLFHRYEPARVAQMVAPWLVVTEFQVQKIVQNFRVTCLFTGQYNAKGYDTITDVMLLLVGSAS